MTHDHCHSHPHPCSCCGEEMCCEERCETHQCCHSHSGEKGEFAKHMLEVAEQAWLEALGDKIKENILKSDTRLNELAKLICDANAERWKHKTAEINISKDFQQKISDFFSQKPS